MTEHSSEKLRRLESQLRRPMNHGFNEDGIDPGPVGEQARKWLIQFAVEHVHGPEEIPYGKEELIVLCPVKDGRRYLETFMEHYFSLGVKHVVFLDNGSTDGTVEALREYDNVTVLRTMLPFSRYKGLMKQYLATRFSENRWCLFQDVDELFDYSFSDVIGLGSLLRYLNENGYTAVTAQMLDMFPEKPLLRETSTERDAHIKELHRFYDISDVSTQSYEGYSGVANVSANDDIEVYRGGIHKTIFGHPAVLTKHPLVFLDEEIRPVDYTVHRISNARVADFTCVLLHYKFLDGLYEQAVKATEEGQYAFGSRKYRKYVQVLDEAPDVRFVGENTRELRSVNELVHNRFLVVSRQYMRLVRDEEGKNGSSGEDRVLDAFLGAQEELGLQKKEVEQLRQQVGKPQEEPATERQEAESLQQQVGRLQGDLTKERRKAESLQRQIQGLHDSRGWKVLTTLHRLKKLVSGRKRTGS